MSIFTFFKVRRFKKAMKGIASNVLEDLVNIANDAGLESQDQDETQSATLKEIFKLEFMAYLLWILRRYPIFSDAQAHRSFLDYVHDEYYAAYKRNGYNFEQRQSISNLLNDRYRKYDDALDNKDPAAVGTMFCRHLSEASDKDLDLTNILLAGEMLKKTGELLQRYRNDFAGL